MSSAEFRPYKSRLFNLISDNYQKFSDTGSRTWRYVKFAASLTVQTALYPLYVMMQTVRVTAKQLGTVVKQHLPQLQNSVTPHPATPPHADTPIHRVLKAATIEAESILFADSPSEPPDHLVRGVACLIETQKLVLVNPKNQVLDVLTASQQHRLQQRIILEVADYYRFQHRLVKQQEPFHSELYPLANQPEILSPIRWFWQVMAWVQISPVAVKVNLFGESRLAAALPPKQPSNSTPSSFRYPQFFCSLDGTIAQVEEQSIFSLIQPRQTLENNQVQGLQKTGSEEERSLESSEDAYFYKIQTLILAAVDYFFGGNQSPDLLEDAPESLPPSYHPVDDPWNTSQKSEQKFAYKQRTEPQAQLKLKGRKTSTSIPVLPQGNTEEIKGIWTKIKTSFINGKSAFLNSEQSALSFRSQPKSSKVAKIVNSPLTIQPKSVKKSNPIVATPSPKTAIPTGGGYAIATTTLSNSESQSQYYPEAKPEWLEAKVTSTGYVKHPLERILEWLDSFMLGLEETFFKIWYWLSNYQK